MDSVRSPHTTRRGGATAPAKERTRAAPATEEELRAVILERYGTLSRQLKKVARYILDNPHDIAFDTVTAVAHRAGVNPSTLVRFAQHLGYEGCSEMQGVFQSRRIRDLSSYHERVQTLGGMERAHDGDWARALGQYVREGVVLLESLTDDISPESLGKAVAMLGQARHVYLLGQGTSYSVAFYLFFALARLQKRCQLLDGSGGFLAEQSETAGAEDVALVITFQPYTPEVLDIAADLHQRGVPVISLTDGPESPVAQASTIILPIRKNTNRLFRSLVAPMCLAQCLAVSLGNYLEGMHRPDDTATAPR